MTIRGETLIGRSSDKITTKTADNNKSRIVRLREETGHQIGIHSPLEGTRQSDTCKQTCQQIHRGETRNTALASASSEISRKISRPSIMKSSPPIDSTRTGQCHGDLHRDTRGVLTTLRPLISLVHAAIVPIPVSLHRGSENIQYSLVSTTQIVARKESTPRILTMSGRAEQERLEIHSKMAAVEISPLHELNGIQTISPETVMSTGPGKSLDVREIPRQYVGM